MKRVLPFALCALVSPGAVPPWVFFCFEGDAVDALAKTQEADQGGGLGKIRREAFGPRSASPLRGAPIFSDKAFPLRLPKLRFLHPAQPAIDSLGENGRSWPPRAT